MSKTKQAIRERIWDQLNESGEARFPYPPHGRIPNFADASTAARRLAETTIWQTATTIKANPDAPQRPVRKRALEDGLTVYMAVPRLQQKRCFLELDPQTIGDYDHASTIGGAADLGTPVHPETMDPIDIIVSGSVAINTSGGRIGKGEGYSDLEFALLEEFGLVDQTTIATTVHEMQVLTEAFPLTTHDVPLDKATTPEREVSIDRSVDRPQGIHWDLLEEQQIRDIPILRELNPEHN